MLERGHIATMYHSGSDTFAECVVLRVLSKAEVAAENEAACGNIPAAKHLLHAANAIKNARGDAGCVRRALAEVIGNELALEQMIFNDLSKDKTTRRLKCESRTLAPELMAKFRSALQRELGDRVIEVDHTPTGYERYSFRSGGELFVRLKVAK